MQSLALNIGEKGVVILCIGLPGSGKTTACKEVARKHPEIVHQSMGDLLRAEAKLSTERAMFVHSCLSQGKLVPVDMGLEILGEFLVQNREKIILLDGYQGTLEYLDPFHACLAHHGFAIKKVIAFDVSIATALARSQGRMREDDAPEALAQRMFIRLSSMDPIKNWYDNKKLLVSINAERPVEQVVTDCQALICAS